MKSNVLAEENNLLLKDLRKRNQISNSKPASPSLIPAPAAASTIEELDELLSSTNITRYLAQCEEPSVGSTLRRMLKSLLTRELAMQMSCTGLNSKRQKTKIAFKTHGAYTMILRALSLTSPSHWSIRGRPHDHEYSAQRWRLEWPPREETRRHCMTT
ncbi:uncharacterized protein LOC108669946 [Hyalella azteca]|uniref:Uncharacterized protein LOC108669946 n=1 Tax=Hyalella azteca TaxID=294128 RepID=A0A8B7NHN0_HYAAZ|nr:uncharacterized protein LOC108669946 [Hyalella azteca]